MAVVVLYEDSARLGSPRFPLHDLVVRCVLDDAGGDSSELRARYVARPLRGSGKLRAACRGDEGRALFDGAAFGVVAVYDLDHLHDLLGRPDGACKTTAKAALRRECPNGARLFPCFIDRNIESLVRALEADHPDLVGRGTFHDAAARKDLAARDDVFVAAARRSAAAVRVSLRARAPSFDYLVRTLVRLSVPPAE